MVCSVSVFRAGEARKKTRGDAKQRHRRTALSDTWLRVLRLGYFAQ
jgi:hypothetical protein